MDVPTGVDALTGFFALWGYEHRCMEVRIGSETDIGGIRYSKACYTDRPPLYQPSRYCDWCTR